MQFYSFIIIECIIERIKSECLCFERKLFQFACQLIADKVTSSVTGCYNAVRFELFLLPELHFALSIKMYTLSSSRVN